MSRPGFSAGFETAMGHPPGYDATASYTLRRAFVQGTGANLGRMVAPAAGGPIDGVSSDVYGTIGYYALPGLAVRVEAGAAFAAGVDLETDANGRMIQKSAGRTVMRSLEASAGAGSLVWASFRN